VNRVTDDVKHDVKKQSPAGAVAENQALPGPKGERMIDDMRDYMEKRERERQERAENSWKTMFRLLKQGGYTKVQVSYDGYSDAGQVEKVTFYQDGEAVEDQQVPQEVEDAVIRYIYDELPGGWETNAGSFGFATIYPASEYVHFDHTNRHQANRFGVGEPGPEVPEWDR
jgi:hypothetical protein